MIEPTKEEIQKLVDDLLSSGRERLKPFDVGYVCALEWILGKRECLYDKK